MKKYVLTGGPGSGKSSMILDLELRGEETVREAAEDWIKYQQARGVKEPWNEEGFQDKILQWQYQREQKIPEVDRVFLDRGTLDGLAYYQLNRKNPSEMMEKEVERLRKEQPYEKIFLVENLGNCEETEVRREKQNEALKIERLQEQNYRWLGFEVIKIPPAKLRERTDLILNKIKE